MRILIQHGLTRGYFNGTGWDSNEKQAAEFENVTEAEQLCREQKLANALIVLKFSDADEGIRYKVSEADVSVSNKVIGFQS